MNTEEDCLLRPDVRRSRPGTCWRVRYTLALLACLGFCVVYGLRVNLSVALVAMVNSTYDGIDGNTNSECPGGNTPDTTYKNGDFNWDQKTQGLILGSFFYGYICTQLPGGWLASQFGGKHLFGFGVLCTSIFTLLTPWAAHQGIPMLIALRILEGLGEGVTFPAMHAIWSSWAPPLERSKLLTLSYAGCQLGNIIFMPLAGVLCASEIAGGWPSVFYIFGSLGILWFVVWTLMVTEKPADHPTISEAERDYIISSIGTSQDRKTTKQNTPWSAIWSSPAVWAIIIAHFCNNWGFYTFLTLLPSYFKEVLNFSILTNGFLSAVPYSTQWLFIVIAGQIADWLLRRRISSVSDVRKVFCVTAFIIPACLLVATSYTGCTTTTLSVCLFSTALGFTGFNLSGFNVNHLDIAPRYAGILMGITNSFGTVPGIAAPYVAGWITNKKPDRAHWQIVFFISAGLYVIGAISFVTLSKGSERRWNIPEKDMIQESVRKL
ncbi:predicted protein [Nematostella vectensis]|uniref:Sialin n=1 Tax=Nematostella vectensis TaxID=45351 RepID=A7RSS9_NEMVE|nr:predicted protein [Nematostella vectensis]|eukprot:XP_001637577.1 predicted protein [Nematostella vectensis]